MSSTSICEPSDISLLLLGREAALHSKATPIEQAVDKTARAALSTGPQPEAAKGWRSWIWSPFKASAPAKESDARRKDTTNENEEAGTSLGGSAGDSPEEPHKENIFVPSALDAGLDDAARNGSPDQEKNADFKDAALKTGHVKNGWLDAAAGALRSTWNFVRAPIQTTVASHENSIDRPVKVAAAKEQMLAHSNQDTQFVQLFDFLNALLGRVAPSALDDLPKSLAELLKSKPGYVTDLIEINLAKGFVNLARRTHEMKDKIPGYEHQSFLVSALSVICQSGTARWNQARVEQIEKINQAHLADLSLITKKLFPLIDKEPKTQELILQLIATRDFRTKMSAAVSYRTIEDELFPDCTTASADRREDIANFENCCRELIKVEEERQIAFSELADDILKNFFPYRFQDLEMPFLARPFAGFIYKQFKDSLANFLRESYAQLDVDDTKKEIWKKDLQVRIGAPDLQAVVDAPSAFALAFIKDQIQSNSGLIDLAQEGLNAACPACVEVEADVTESIDPMAQLAREQLANWIVESAQQLLNTKDSHLAGLGHFVDRCLNNLTLAFLANGAKLTIPEGEEIKGNEFIKELTDRLIAKLSAVKGDETMPDEFWIDFVGELPLPPFIKDLLVPLVIKKSKDLHSLVKEKVDEFKEVEQLYQETEAKVKKFKRGEELLSIAEKIGDLAVENLLEKKFEWASKYGLGDTLNELLTQYLPHVEISDDLNQWFEDNLNALGNSQKGVTSQAVNLLKRAIQTVVLKALVNTIETNFQNGDDYASQLLQNIYRAGAEAFKDFDEDQIQQLKRALVKLSEIQEANAKLAAVKRKLAEGPKGLEKGQTDLIEETLRANMLYSRAEDYVNSLDAELQEALSALNNDFDPEEEWERDELPVVQRATVLYQLKAGAFSSREDFEAHLTAEVGDLANAAQSEDPIVREAALDEIEIREILLDLLELSSDDFKKLSHAINIHKTMQHAINEMEKFEGDLKTKKQAVDDHRLGNLANRPQWENAVTWLDEALAGRNELHRLTEHVAKCNQELDADLKIFQALSIKLAALVGLDKTELSKLPDILRTPFLKAPFSFMQDLDLLSYIEAAKNEYFARLLFEQLTPMIMINHDVQKNKERLKEIADGDPFLIQLAEWISAQAVEHLSDYVTNYRTFAEQILKILCVKDPTQAEIERMEESLRLVMIEAGKDKVESSKLESWLIDNTADEEKLIEAGRVGVDVSVLQPMLKGSVPDDKVDELSVSLEQWMTRKDGAKLTEDSLFAMLRTAMLPSNEEERAFLERKSSYLAQKVNKELINRGKKSPEFSYIADLRKSLETWIEQADEEELSDDLLLDMLKKDIPASVKIEPSALNKKAKYLAHKFNEFLITEGKRCIDAQDLFDAYQEQAEGRQEVIQPDNIKEALALIKSEKIVEKIQAVWFTHDEIAQALNETIPGAKDLHSLIAPQLEEVVTGQDEALKKNRDFIQAYIEGMLLQLFVKIGNANEKDGQSIIASLVANLKNVVPTPEKLKGKNTEEVGQEMIDSMLKDVFGLGSADDLEGIPIVLRKICFTKLKEKAYHHLLPFLLPLIEREKNKVKLKDLSGSAFLGHLSEALAKDLFPLLPAWVNSYRAVGIELFVLLSARQPTKDEADQFASEIAELVKRDKQFPVTDSQLADAYAKVAVLQTTASVQDDLVAKLETRQAIKAILNIKITPEDLRSEIGKKMPSVPPALLEAVAGEMQSLIHDHHQDLQQGPGFLEACVEGVLLKVFIRIAEKNPPQNGKDSLILLTEKLLDEAAKSFDQAKRRPPQEVAQEFSKWVMDELLGIDSAAVFQGLPDTFKEIIYQKMTDQLQVLFHRIQKSFATLEKSDQSVEEAQRNVKKYGIGDAALKGYAQILSEDLAELIVASVPNSFAQMGNNQLRGVNLITKGVESGLEELVRGNLAIANVLLSYGDGGQFKSLLADKLTNLADPKQLAGEKQKAADLLANLIIVPLNRVLEKTIRFEREHGEAFNLKLMANVLTVAADHFGNLNQAKKVAVDQGRSEILHQDFVAAAGNQLHPAVPTKGVNLDESIKLITDEICKQLSTEEKNKWQAEQDNLSKELQRLVSEENNLKGVMSIDDVIGEVAKIYLKVKGVLLTDVDGLKALKKNGLSLRDLIREEAAALDTLRKKAAYAPASQIVMQMLFPKGKEDLTFVPEELRSQVWSIFEDNLFPSVLQAITEALLDSDTIKTIVLSSLEAIKTDLDDPIVLESGESTNRAFDALDEASGAVINELIKTVNLPAWIRQKMIDPKTDEIYPAIGKGIGTRLRKHLNRTFIREKVASALEKLVERDAKGHYLLQFDKDKVAKAAKKAEDQEFVQEKLKRVPRELVDAGISYFIRGKWAEVQSHFDELIARAYGKIGMKLKLSLDAVFGFIFFKIVGTILGLLFSPVKGFVKEIIYEQISLDKNFETLLALLTKAPNDQPLKGGYVVYNEDLIYHLGHAIKTSVDEVLTKPVPAAGAA